ncbi:hypothetical protein EYZ11_009002 [Aspergillus tanneri]|uniref:Uncharacterized protein n=1 Tax=Aspergillus tanneri TaxID=1220188 RepID=A0A4S3J911_9EURO|nr:hypothetical protein EYZ11_009002 [Aspergillus tanneri]
MIGLQRSLETAGTVPLDPLVWFLANRGDEWRVYGCVPDRSHIRVIDLWHGCILRHDSALQLLLIIDLLCDWARDIFTEQVMCSIRQQTSQDYATLPSQSSLEELALRQPGPSNNSRGFRLPSAGTSSPWPVQDDRRGPGVFVRTELNDMIMDEVPNITQEVEQIEETPSPTTSSSDTSEDSEDLDILPDTWPECMAVKSDKDIERQFRSVSLPESTYRLGRLLKVLGREADLVQTALKLLDLFNLNNPFIVEPEFVDRISAAWGGRVQNKRPRNMGHLYACLHWRTRFDYDDWILTKELSCITASVAAIAALATIGKIPTTNLFPEGGPKPTNRARRLIHPLRYLPLPELVQAASRSQFLHLEVSDGIAKARGWVEDSGKALFSEHFWKCLSITEAFTVCSGYVFSNIRRLPRSPMSRDEVEIPVPLQISEIAKERQVALLRRSRGAEAIEPAYCVFVFNSLHAYIPFTIGDVKTLQPQHENRARRRVDTFGEIPSLGISTSRKRTLSLDMI